MKNKLYLIHFPDGTFSLQRVKPQANLYKPTAKFYAVSPSTTLDEISIFLGLRFKPKGMREVSK